MWHLHVIPPTLISEYLPVYFETITLMLTDDNRRCTEIDGFNKNGICPFKRL